MPTSESTPSAQSPMQCTICGEIAKSESAYVGTNSAGETEVQCAKCTTEILEDTGFAQVHRDLFGFFQDLEESRGAPLGGEVELASEIAESVAEDCDCENFGVCPHEGLPSEVVKAIRSA